MTRQEKGYRIFLNKELRKEKNPERWLCLERELHQLDHFGYEKRATCKMCGEQISQEKLQAHLRTTICSTCHANQSVTLPYASTQRPTLIGV